jgi:signal transduction histidine kinase/CheY-like chemotaxis protein
VTISIINIKIKTEFDVVAARQRARQISGICGFANQDQVRIATAVSELARNVFRYVGEGKISFSIEGKTSPQLLKIIVDDQGPGIKNLSAILAGEYISSTGMGKGIIGCRELMDKFDIETGPSGTSVTLQKILPAHVPVISASNSVQYFSQLNVSQPDTAISEIAQQNHELMDALSELKARQNDLLQLTHELEDTNRGVVALYAELDEKANHLQRADEMKSRFLSNMSHEFRTPLSSIRALTKLLLSRTDGELTDEQEKQLTLIMKGALSLSELVDDLLDIAKIEAGKTEVHPHEFSVSELFSALRGMLRPLLVSDSLALNFLDLEEDLILYTDEAKLSQILRNFISNALKFTERGYINVAVSKIDSEHVKFDVVDTGIGIDPKDVHLIFEEFGQIESKLQRKVKGTGLGLPLCNKLAVLMGGSVSVISTPGEGSTFSLILPIKLVVKEDSYLRDRQLIGEKIDERKPILIVEDNSTVQLFYKKIFQDSDYRIVIANSVREANELWSLIHPVAVLLDIMLFGETTWTWLAEVKNDSARKHVPVIVVSDVEDKRKGLSLGADAYYVKPIFKYELLNVIETLILARDGVQISQ